MSLYYRKCHCCKSDIDISLFPINGVKYYYEILPYTGISKIYESIMLSKLCPDWVTFFIGLDTRYICSDCALQSNRNMKIKKIIG